MSRTLYGLVVFLYLPVEWFFLQLPVKCVVTKWLHTHLGIKLTLLQIAFEMQNQTSPRLERWVVPKSPSATDKQALVWSFASAR